MKILVTGGNGLLGSSFSRFKSEYDIYQSTREDFDITDEKAVNNFFKQHCFDVIIHCAANTNVEQCEVDQKVCRKINVEGTKNILNACEHINPLFILISSTGNYGNYQDLPYSENERVKPTTIHHKSKVEAEQLVTTSDLEYLIIRTGWLFGGSKEHQKNFVHKRYLEAQGKEVIYSNPTQRGNPTWTLELARQVLKLIHEKKRGIYNCVNEGDASRLEYVAKILELFNLECKAEPAPEGFFDRKAPVSDNEMASIEKLKSEGLYIMSAWQDALKKYIQELKQEKGSHG